MTADRSIPHGWRWVRFGDVVREVKVATKDPEADGLTRVVGLEHLDPESLPLRRWNELADLGDGTSFSRVFRSGQVLFGKRRAYQRKVAVPEFDGVCSGDILVFEPLTGDLLLEFLPYLVQSDGFFDHALGTSAGSLSPRTKFQELAKYEFALPPVPEQHQIVEVLAAATSSAHIAGRVIDAARAMRDSVIHGATSSAPEVALGSLLSACDYGVSIAPADTGDLPILRMNNLDGEELSVDDLRWVSSSEVSENDLVQPGDVLFNRTNSVEHVGKVALVPDEIGQMTFASYLIRLRVDETIALPAFVAGFLQSRVGRARIGRYVSRGVSQANVNSTNLRKVLVPLPPLLAQRRIVDQWEAARGVQAAATHTEARAREATSRLRERLLAGTDQ